jgi:SNF2 family DNA or RNA helicase
MALYEAIRRQAVERIEGLVEQGENKHIEVLAEITRLRLAACHPKLVMPDSQLESSKLQAFAELVTELRENRHRALVFSQFVKHLDKIRAWLDAEKIPYQYLDGSTPPEQRKERVDAFQNNQGEIFLISLKAGGFGLNLTAADYVIHMDPWWNPAVEDQASDRAHRIGQQRPVTVYRLVAENTIEEKIVRLHQHKRDLADSLLEGSDMSGKLTTKELLAMLQSN